MDSVKVSRSGSANKKSSQMFVPYINIGGTRTIAGTKSGTRSKYATLQPTDWVYDWAAVGITMPTVLYQFKNSPDRATMVLNLGTGGSGGNGAGTSNHDLPEHSPSRGAIFRGGRNQAKIGDGIMTTIGTSGTGTFYYSYSNIRTVGDIEAITAVWQRSGLTNNPRCYMSHVFGGADIEFGSGSIQWTTPMQDAGSLAMSPGKAYKNGVLVNGALNATWGSMNVAVGNILATASTFWPNTGGNPFCCDMSTFAYWATSLSDGDITTWEAAVTSFLLWSPPTQPSRISSPLSPSMGGA